MKQRIAVRAILRDGDKTLLLKRSSGRETILGAYELPGGRVEYGEQPEDALARCLHDDAGLTMQTATLFDVLSYIDHDDRDIQYVLILYLVRWAADGKIHLGDSYSKYAWRSMSDAQREKLTESTKLLLGITQQQITSDNPTKLISNDVIKSTDLTRVIIYSDGGSRGNPGPSAAGFVVMDMNERIVHEGGMYLGITTNNQAEYHGVRLGLEKALAMEVKTIDFRLDSLLVVNQMNGVYTIKNRELWPINDRIHDLVAKFDKVTFSHVGREYNQLADGMVNKILNAHAGK